MDDPCDAEAGQTTILLDAGHIGAVVAAAAAATDPQQILPEQENETISIQVAEQ